MKEENPRLLRQQSAEWQVFDRSALCVEELRHGNEDYHGGQSHRVAAKVSHQTGLTNTKIFTVQISAS